MVDVILHAAGAKESVLWWPYIGTHITALFDESSPPSLNQAITLAAPCVPWSRDGLNTKNAVIRWATAASAVPYSEEVCQNVIKTLLKVSYYGLLRPHIPINTWAWLKRRPALPPVCWVRSNGSTGPIVHHVRGLGDIEILKSYFLLVWSEWDGLWADGFVEMEISIREDFGGIGMWCHRDDLIKHLDHVQGELDQGLEYLEQDNPWIDEGDIQQRKHQYSHLKNTLLEVDKRAMETLIRMPPGLIVSVIVLITVMCSESHAILTCAVPLLCP